MMRPNRFNLRRANFIFGSLLLAAGLCQLFDFGQIEDKKDLSPAEIRSQMSSLPTPVLESIKRSDLDENLEKAIADFQGFADTVLLGLPRVSELRNLPAEQLHGTPPALLGAAVSLGEMAERLAKDDRLQPQGLRFYQTCSLAPDYATSVRALCLNRALRLSVRMHHSAWNFDPEKIPNRVQELAKRL